MTGAGAGEMLFARESSFDGAPIDSDSSGTPETYSPGRNETWQELSLQRQLERLREAGKVESVESVAQNLEGAAAVQAIVSNDTFKEVEKFVFNSGPGSSFTPGRPQSATFWTDINYLSGTATRELSGCIPVDFEINYSQGGMVTYTLRMVYKTEQRNVSIPTSEATRVSDGTSAPFHGFDLSIDGTSVSKLQECTLTIGEIARLQRGAAFEAVDAVIANPTTSLDVTGIIASTDKLEYAYGSATATAPSAQMTARPATVTINTAGGTTVSTYSLPAVKPDQYDWEDIIASDDATDSYQMHVNDGVSVT